MALIKDIENNQGTLVGYWKVVSVYRNTMEKFVDVVLYGFVTEVARRAEKRNADMKVVRVEKENYELYFGLAVLAIEGNTDLTQAYLATKSLDINFIDAIDDIVITN